MILNKDIKKKDKKRANTVKDARISGSRIKRQFGGRVPESIIKADFGKRQIDSFMSGRSRTNELGDDKHMGPSARAPPMIYSERAKKKVKITLSRFPMNVGKIMVNLYTEPNDWVFDPFAGHNSRMEFVFKAGRNYYGNDISHDFMEKNKAIRKQLTTNPLFGQPTILLNEGDSRLIDSSKFPEFFDFCITSPPYYRQEYYGEEEGQLYFTDTYPDFLEGLLEVIEICYKVLKYGAYCAWFINDFRYKKTFLTYHADIIVLFRRVGFQIHDIVIVDLGKAIGSCYPNQFKEYKIFPKRHEYCIVGKKIEKKIKK